MHCPFCQHVDTRVIDSRVSEDGATIRRRRECEACGERFNTLETIEIKLPVIIKGDGRREQFDARKLRVSFDRALQKRPVVRGTGRSRGARGRAPTAHDHRTRNASLRVGEFVMRRTAQARPCRLRAFRLGLPLVRGRRRFPRGTRSPGTRTARTRASCRCSTAPGGSERQATRVTQALSRAARTSRRPMSSRLHRQRPRDDGARAAPGRARRLHDQAESDGRLRDRARMARSSAKAGTSAPAGRMPRCSRCKRPASARAARPPTSRWSPARTSAAPAPCADALVAAGVARVVGAMRDPNPLVDGAGFERLQRRRHHRRERADGAAGAPTQPRLLSRIERGRPWLRIKLAISIDGRSALASGDSKWISGEASRAGRAALARAQRRDPDRRRHRADRRSAADRAPAGRRAGVRTRLRAAGAGRARPGPGHRGARPRSRRRCADALHPCRRCAHAARHRCRARARAGAGGAFRSATPCCALLAARDINEVQVEAGATLAGAFLAAGLVDELLLYVAPVILGDTRAADVRGPADRHDGRAPEHVDRRNATHRRRRAPAAAARGDAAVTCAMPEALP